jgi:ABC-2 type transport system ATP-binding protein
MTTATDSRAAAPTTPPASTGAAALAIDVRNLSKRFGGKTVVDRLAIRVPRGRICGFLGPNGSGKTTTIRMLCGLLTPDDGEGTCLGFDIRTQSREIKRRVGYMTQRFGLYEDLSIEENLAFVARVYQVPRPRQAVDGALEQLGLAARRTQLAGTLSGGWKQRLALASCLLHDPELLLLDEPTAGVDPKARRDFWAEIHALAARGITVLVSTHYMDEAERCHQIAYLSYGRLLVAGTAEQAIADARLRTWRITGKDGSGGDLARVLALAERDGRWMVVPFGTALHVTGAAGAGDFADDAGNDFPRWLAQQAPGHSWTVTPIDTGLEDLFISLMDSGRDGN